VPSGNDQEQVAEALRRALAEEERPTLIAVRTAIGFGAPTKVGTADAHGAALGQDELDAAKARFGWPVGESFVVPADVRAHLAGVGAAGQATAEAWDRRFAAWSRIYPDLAEEWTRTQAGGLPAGWSDALSAMVHPEKPTATRVTSGLVLSALAAGIPELVGGSADLAGSTNTQIPGDDVGPGRYSGRNIHFGVREHAMGAVMNGMALHRGLRPFGSTFLVFSDYLRPALRLAALGKLGGGVRLHPRLDRVGRGRSHPSAGGAPRITPADPEPGRAAPRRLP
jgi:transketolase